MSLEKNNVRLPYALRESDGVEVHISEIGAYRGNFLCIECGGRLKARRGGEREHHFAHYTGQGNNCSLTKKEGVEDYERKRNEHPDKYRLSCSAIPRGLVAITVRNNNARLWHRLIPSKVEHDFSDNIYDHTTINDSKFDPSMDYSCDGDTYFQINSSEKKYIIKIGGSLPEGYPEIQESIGVRAGDVFISSGSKHDRFADRVEYGSCSIDYGNILYVVDNLGTIPLVGSSHKLRKYEVREDNIELIEKELKLWRKDISPFSTDVLLPAFINPSTKRGITGKTDSQVLIGIHPRKKIPCVEMIAYETDKKTSIHINDRVGVLFKKIGVKPDYFSIHWGTTHQEMSIIPSKEHSTILACESGCLFVFVDGTRCVLKGGDSIEIDANILKIFSECVSTQSTRNIVFNYKMMLKNNKIHTDKGTIKDISEKMKEYFTVLNSITMWINRSKKIEIKIRRIPLEESIKVAILKVGIPKKTNKTYLKRILTEIKLTDMPGGFQKKVRRIMREIKNE